ncbi:hypothetical protein ACFTY7_17175 [Streptomyces sp. NPDC057062]|uniref:hypothetical protein n=1 Tax=Streptomyces sp. NPDC057062 TaxID=3346011 RepID=UPI0036309259
MATGRRPDGEVANNGIDESRETAPSSPAPPTGTSIASPARDTLFACKGGTLTRPDRPWIDAHSVIDVREAGSDESAVATRYDEPAVPQEATVPVAAVDEWL